MANIGYSSNFGSHAAAPCWYGVADWENAQMEQINRDFQAAMPDLIAQAQETLDDEEFASMTQADYREWFYDNASDYTTASREMLRLWI